MTMYLEDDRKLRLNQKNIITRFILHVKNYSETKKTTNVLFDMKLMEWND